MYKSIEPKILLTLYITSIFYLDKQVSSFWFADSSLFQPTNSPEIVFAASSNVSSPKVDQNKQQQQQEPLCQCNLDLIQNQTNSALARWLNSGNFTEHIRSLVSNSTGARVKDPIISSRSSGRFWLHQDSSNTNNSRWPSWSSSNQTNAAVGLRDKTALHNSNNGSGARHQTGSSRHSRQQQQQQQVKLLPGEPGPRGPKGDTGPRGEKGEPGKSGLSIVKNRDELFDLFKHRSSSGQEEGSLGSQRTSSPDGAILVFIEAEQMLVVRTKTGWRPVQLSSPLKDFRDSITKFNLNSSNRRFIQVANTDMMRPSSDHVVRSRTKFVSIDNNNDDDDNEAADDDDDVDNDEDENDIDDEAADDDAEEDDDDQDDNDLDGDWDDSEDEGKSITRRAKFATNKQSGTGKARSIESNKVALLARGPIMGRSASTSFVDAPTDLLALETNQVNYPAEADMDGGPEVSATTKAPSNLVDTRKATEQQQQPASINHRDSSKNNGLKLRLVALNEPFSGNIHGIRGADFECKRNAAKTKMKGSFRALLATGFQNLNELVRYNTHKYPIVNLRGETLANSWNDLFKHQAPMANPLSRIYSFDGRHVATDSNWPNKLVWLGISNKLGYRDLMNNCDAWHSESLNKFGSASPLHNQPSTTKDQLNTKPYPRRHKKRSGYSSIGPMYNKTNNISNNTLVLDHGTLFESIGKYPCKMPLILLCIETIGQQLEAQLKPNSRQDQLSSENNWDSVLNNQL